MANKQFLDKDGADYLVQGLKAKIPTKVSELTNDSGFKTTDNDTKNTAGSTDTSSKIFLVGATSQAANPQTYSHDTAYVGTDGCLYSNGKKVLTDHQSLSSLVPNTRTVNGKALSSDISLTASDVGALPSDTVIPTVNNATLTIQKNGTTVKTFTANASDNVTANITVPTKVSELTNDSGYKTTDNNTTYSLTQDATNGHKITLTPSTGTAQTITIPDNNTTYTFATGDANGQIKVTPSGGTAQNISVKGLGSNAYSSTEYLPLAGGTLTGQTGINALSTALGASFSVKNTASAGPQISLGVGTGGVNHGVYSETLDKWLVYGNASDVYLNGRASTASKLATARKINGVSFDGSADITVADSTKVAKTGDTMTGNLTISKASPNITIKATDTSNASLTLGNSNYNREVLKLYNASSNGGNLTIDSGGITVIGSGEGAQNLLGALGTSTDSEVLYLVSDNQIHLESNAQTLANRVGYQIDNSGNIIPEKAEVATNNFGSLGTSSYKLANVYATTIHGALDGNASTATTAARQVITGMDVQTGDTKQSHITLQTLMTWLITTKQYIPNGVNCHVILRPTWSYAANDILQINDGEKNYELQLAGCEIDFKGQSTGFDAGTFTLRISTAPTSSFTAASGYTDGKNSQFVYRCNGNGYTPNWKRIAYYSEVLPRSGGTMTGDLLFSDSGTGTRQVRFTAGTNDYGRIAAGATASNAGWMEIATADDGNEPVYARQYTGTFTTIKRTATLLDANGDTTFPQKITSTTGSVGLTSAVSIDYNSTDKCIEFNFS